MENPLYDKLLYIPNDNENKSALLEINMIGWKV